MILENFFNFCVTVLELCGPNLQTGLLIQFAIIILLALTLIFLGVKFYRIKDNYEDLGHHDVQDEKTFGREWEKKNLTLEDVIKQIKFIILACFSFLLLSTSLVSAQDLGGYEQILEGTLIFQTSRQLTISYANRDPDIIPAEDIWLPRNHCRALDKTRATIAKKESPRGEKVCVIYAIKSNRFDFILITCK